MMKNIFVAMVFGALFGGLLAGCAKFEILPQNITLYSKGVKIIQSQKQDSKVQLEIAQRDTLDDLLVFYVSAQLNSPKAILFSTDNVRASFDNQALKIYTYEEIAESDYNFIDILQDYNIPTPTPSAGSSMAYNIAPFYYYAYPGFMYFSPMLSPFYINNSQDIAFRQEKRGALKVLLMNYLRESTLSHEISAQGGFVAISKKQIKKDGLLKLEVQINHDIHTFAIDMKSF